MNKEVVKTHNEFPSHLEGVESFVGAHLWGAIIGGSHSDAVNRGAQPRSYRKAVFVLW